MKKILVVEDDLNTRFITSEVLKSVNYSVSCVENGQEAMQAMSENSYDLVITDIMMPLMDGKELLKNIRRIRGSHFPVIVTSGVDFASVHVLQSDFTIAIQKPYAFDVLLDKVDSLMN